MRKHHQDAPKRLHREGGAKSGAWGQVAIGRALQASEDSVKLNTSFVERLNLTVRHGSAYLGRRTISHARCKKQLQEHLELLRCYYNPASYCLTALCL